MPQLFKFGAYSIYFWSNESRPLEPIHVHISEGRARPNATKIWITRSGGCVLANNTSHIPPRDLRRAMMLISANIGEIEERWQSCFGEITYYC